MSAREINLITYLLHTDDWAGVWTPSKEVLLKVSYKGRLMLPAPHLYARLNVKRWINTMLIKTNHTVPQYNLSKSESDCQTILDFASAVDESLILKK